MEKLTPQDLQQIQQKGLTQNDIEKQVRNFEQGFPYTHLARPARIGDGIYQPGQVDLEHFQHVYHRAPNDLSVMKFVPASGAATRMFKSLFEYLEDSSAILPEVETFIQNLSSFAFYDDLRSSLESKGQEISQLIQKKDYVTIIRELLGDGGLGYGTLPKGMIKFHQYSDHSRTPAEEHMVEGAHYSQNHNHTVKIHFTVLPEHEEKFRTYLSDRQHGYEESFDLNYRIDFSNQHESTDMVAVDLDNQLFRQPDGRLLFRPGGHGALLNNLNDLDEDLIFIKNIDNVVPDRFKQTTYDYKKALAGMLLEYQQETFQYLREMKSGGFDEARLPEILEYAENRLNIFLPEDLDPLDSKALYDYLFARLNRPIRVCGMVKNQGEPGGGPFWVKDPDGSLSLQIVEKPQINQNDPGQKQILEASTHFNPVDLVCGVKDYKGNKFDLYRYRDPSAGLISTKSKGGRSLKAQELPGLWNGGMAYWNTIFVEVPLITFNPVKTVNDLLREEHQQI
ncbi:MAG: DUF4301 family protein [Bacteroidales bacterium]|nr:DUF4301 family protein [Bacteroidales bacterium]